MSPWNVAAAQYTPCRQGIDAHVQHHLRFIDAAARQQCHLLVFPELSLTGPANESGLLVAPPSEHDLAPVVRAVHTHNITVIAGVTLNSKGIRQKGVALFSLKLPNRCAINRAAVRTCPQTTRTCSSLRTKQNSLLSIRWPHYLPAVRQSVKRDAATRLAVCSVSPINTLSPS